VPTNASKRLKGIRGSTFEVDLEYNETYIIIHLPYIDKFTKSTLFEMKYLLDDWWTFFKTVGYTEIHAAVDPNNRSINKILRHIEFKKIGSSNGMNIWSYRGD